MKLTTTILLSFFLVFGMACQNGAPKEEVEMMSWGDNQAPAAKQKAEDKPVDLKLIKEGTVAFEAGSLSEARKTIAQAVERHKGYISSEQEIKQADRYTTTIVIRVPSANFDQLLAEATSGVTRFETKEIKVQDVSEEFVDIQARVKTKKELENRFIELLKKSNKVSEAIEIEKQIGELRAEIESIEGRMRYLENRVSLSTLTMIIHEPIVGESLTGLRFKMAFQNGWGILIGFFVVLAHLWPLLLIAAGALFGLVFYKRKKNRKGSITGV